MRTLNKTEQMYSVKKVCKVKVLKRGQSWRRLWSLFGFDQAFLHQAAVELLDVGVHALPVRLFHPDQVISIEQGGAARQPPADRTDKWLQTNNSTELGGHLVLNAPLELVPAEMRQLLHIRDERSLCGAEGQLEVVPGLGGVEGGVLEGVREEAVHQGTEGYPVFPT